MYLHLHACQVRVTVGNSGLCCYTLLLCYVYQALINFFVMLMGVYLCLYLLMYVGVVVFTYVYMLTAFRDIFLVVKLGE